MKEIVSRPNVQYVNGKWKPVTQLDRARQEIADYMQEHYPHGKCDECGFALDKDGNCTRGNYMGDEE